jgi:hypothetical protein
MFNLVSLYKRSKKEIILEDINDLLSKGEHINDIISSDGKQSIITAVTSLFAVILSSGILFLMKLEVLPFMLISLFMTYSVVVTVIYIMRSNRLIEIYNEKNIKDNGQNKEVKKRSDIIPLIVCSLGVAQCLIQIFDIFDMGHGQQSIDQGYVMLAVFLVYPVYWALKKI